MVAHIERLLYLFATAVPVLYPLLVTAQPVTQPFTFSNVAHTLPHLAHASVAPGDFDNDGDLDALVIGLRDDAPFARLFRNAGRSDSGDTVIFEEIPGPFPNLAFGTAAWGDYDGDGDLDVLLAGSRTAEPPYEAVTLLYRNEDHGFVPAAADLEGFHSGAAAWGDFDNDGDLDLAVGGERSDGVSVTLVYVNEGLELLPAAQLPGIAYGDVAPTDFDADGDVDLALAGAGSDGFSAAVFQNDDGAFSRAGTPLAASAFADLDWGDYDGDGDLDLLLSGGTPSPRLLDAHTMLFRNVDSGFSEIELALPDVLSGTTAWGDYDNDGDLDLLLTGSQGVFGGRLARLYANDEGTLSEKVRTLGVTLGSASWGDLEADGDLDLFVTGLPTSNIPFVNLYENKRQVRTGLRAPDALRAEVAGRTATLRWESRPEAASYNVRVGKRPGAGDVVAPMSDPATGRRLVFEAGNASRSDFRRLQNLPPGTYFWSVQAVDAAFSGSAFASEHTFTVGQSTAREHRETASRLHTELHPANPNPSGGPVTVRYTLSDPVAARIRIYDVLGRTVATLVDRHQLRGRHQLVWDTRDARGVEAGSGLYVVRLEAGDLHRSTSFVLSR